MILTTWAARPSIVYIQINSTFLPRTHYICIWKGKCHAIKRSLSVSKGITTYTKQVCERILCVPLIWYLPGFSEKIYGWCLYISRLITMVPIHDSRYVYGGILKITQSFSVIFHLNVLIQGDLLSHRAFIHGSRCNTKDPSRSAV